jgi:hypothetical protein
MGMDTVLRFRGREIRSKDVVLLREIVAGNPGANRRALSFKVCEALDWKQGNGTPCDALCRALMLKLHRAGHLQLPPTRWIARNPRRHSVVTHVDVVTQPLVARLADLGPIEIRQVRRTPEEALVKSLIHEHHYLGYAHPVGEHLKYLVSARGQPIACFCWSSAARHLGPRDRYIGWSKEQRRARIRFIAYQSRFLILPWVQVSHLASHLLGAISRRLSDDWMRVYAHPIYFTETFVDPTRFRGTCYRAANWTVLGMTTGRGKDAPTSAPNRSLKQLFAYPLVKNFRAHLCGEE